jgi:hypothetical protein
MSRLTKRQRELKAQYTGIIGEYGEYRAILKVGCQSFGIGDISAGKSHAELMARMLAIALDNLIREETHAAE